MIKILKRLPDIILVILAPIFLLPIAFVVIVSSLLISKEDMARIRVIWPAVINPPAPEPNCRCIYCLMASNRN